LGARFQDVVCENAAVFDNANFAAAGKNVELRNCVEAIASGADVPDCLSNAHDRQYHEVEAEWNLFCRGHNENRQIKVVAGVGFEPTTSGL